MPDQKNLELKSLYYRGTIIESCIELEKAIEGFIIFYLSDNKDKQMEIASFLLDRMHFDGKISVFQVILKKLYDKDFKRKFDKLMGKLRFAKDERNVFAHYMLSIDDETIADSDKQLTFFSIRNQPDYVVYKYEDINRMLISISESVIIIEELTRKHSISPSDPSSSATLESSTGDDEHL